MHPHAWESHFLITAVSITADTCALQLLWKGDEAMADALELVGVAEAAAARAASSRGSWHPSGEHSEVFVWRQPLMRPAGNAQQVS